MTVRGKNAERVRLRLDGATSHEIELSYVGVTHTGLRRENNEDSYVVAPPLFAVADGMGGHSAGEIASAAVVRRLAELGGSSRLTEADVTSALVDAVEDIEVDAGDTDLGAGTTVTGAWYGHSDDGPTWSVFNIGDSRVYQYFKGSLAQLTVDHSVVQHLIDTGAISEEEAEYHPHANVITRAVGFNEEPVPDVSAAALIPGQRMLICSDGLTKELTDIGIQHFLATGGSTEETAQALLDAALGNAGRDNITLIVIDVHAVDDLRDTADFAALEITAPGPDASAEEESGDEPASPEPVQPEPVEPAAVEPAAEEPASVEAAAVEPASSVGGEEQAGRSL